MNNNQRPGHKPVVCVWKNGSSTMKTMKAGLPKPCRDKGCTGEFESKLLASEFCKEFMDKNEA